MTYHPQDTQYVLATQGDSRAAGHYKFNHEKAKERQEIEGKANAYPLYVHDIYGRNYHPYDTEYILRRQRQRE